MGNSRVLKFSQSDLKLVSEQGTRHTYPKNAVLINQGEQSDSLYVILEGRVKVYVGDADGKEIILNIQGPGEYFGELAVIDEEPRSASVMTLEKSQLSVVSRADFLRCIARNPHIAMDLIRTLTARVRALTENVSDLALLDVYGRVASTLLKLASKSEDGRSIEQRLTHQDIANMVGASREMVSRIMKDLIEGGYIQLENKIITIPGRLPSAW